MSKHLLLCLHWTIKENGMPPLEGEFCSLHVDAESLEHFLQQYWSAMPREVPGSYACPAEGRGAISQPFWCAVDPRTHDRIVKSGLGLWSTTVPHQSTEAVSIIPSEALMSLLEGVME